MSDLQITDNSAAKRAALTLVYQIYTDIQNIRERRTLQNKQTDRIESQLARLDQLRQILTNDWRNS